VNGGAVVLVAGVAVEVAGTAAAAADTALDGAEDVAPVDVAQPVRNNTNALARRTVASFTVTPCTGVRWHVSELDDEHADLGDPVGQVDRNLLGRACSGRLYAQGLLRCLGFGTLEIRAQ
jgi:hypothetical protein